MSDNVCLSLIILFPFSFFDYIYTYIHMFRIRSTGAAWANMGQSSESEEDDDDYTPDKKDMMESDDEFEVDKEEIKREIQELQAEEKVAKKIDFKAAQISWSHFTAHLSENKTMAPNPDLDMELDSSQHGLPLLFKSLAAGAKTPDAQRSRDNSPKPNKRSVKLTDLNQEEETALQPKQKKVKVNTEAMDTDSQEEGEDEVLDHNQITQEESPFVLNPLKQVLFSPAGATGAPAQADEEKATPFVSPIRVLTDVNTSLFSLFLFFSSFCACYVRTCCDAEVSHIDILVSAHDHDDLYIYIHMYIG